jgi:hypothetical protein
MGISTRGEMRLSLESVSSPKKQQSINHWVPSLYRGVLRSVTSPTSSKAIGSDTFEVDVITKGLHKILTMKLGLYRLTAMRDARAKIDNNPQ